MKRIMYIFTAFIILLFISVIPVSASVKITPKSTKMLTGEKKQLKINTEKKVKWSSQNKKIATVSKKGVVTAKKKGTTIIYAKVGKKKYSCKVTVYKAGSRLIWKYKRTGGGEFYLSTAGGTAYHGETVDIYYPADIWVADITVNVGSEDMSGDDFDISKPVWIYIDRIKQETISTGFFLQASVQIKESTLKAGSHIVEVLQYQSNNPRKKAIFYRKAKYRIIH